MPTLKINVNNFSKGVSTSDFLPDRGYSPADKGQNLYVKKGLLYPQPLETARGALSDDGCACIGINQDLGADVYGLVADNGDGYYYSFDASGVPTLKSTDTGRTYSSYASDLVFYKGSFHITSKTNITLIASDFTTPDYDWWTAVAGGSSLNTYLPHQMIVFDDVMYIADDNDLKSWDGSNKNNSALYLQSDYKITAIVVYQNKIYITAEKLYNASGKQAVTSKLFIWDGTSPSYEAQFDIPEKIFSMVDYNGTLLLFGVYTLFAWNGIGITPIFDLPTPNQPVYKQKIVKYKDRLYFANGDYIICYDKNIFSYVFDTSNSGGNLTGDNIESIFIEGDDNLIFTAGKNAYSLQLDSGAGAGHWLSNRYEFPENIRIKEMIVELGEDMVSGSDMEFTIINERGDEVDLGDMTYADGSRRVKQLKSLNIIALSLQVRVNFKTNAKPIRAITIFYEGVGNPVRKV